MHCHLRKIRSPHPGPSCSRRQDQRGSYKLPPCPMPPLITPQPIESPRMHGPTAKLSSRRHHHHKKKRRKDICERMVLSLETTLFLQHEIYDPNARHTAERLFFDSSTHLIASARSPGSIFGHASRTESSVAFNSRILSSCGGLPNVRGAGASGFASGIMAGASVEHCAGETMTGTVPASAVRKEERRRCASPQP